MALASLSATYNCLPSVVSPLGWLKWRDLGCYLSNLTAGPSVTRYSPRARIVAPNLVGARHGDIQGSLVHHKVPGSGGRV